MGAPGAELERPDGLCRNTNKMWELCATETQKVSRTGDLSTRVGRMSPGDNSRGSLLEEVDFQEAIPFHDRTTPLPAFQKLGLFL